MPTEESVILHVVGFEIPATLKAKKVIETRTACK